MTESPARKRQVVNGSLEAYSCPQVLASLSKPAWIWLQCQETSESDLAVHTHVKVGLVTQGCCPHIRRPAVIQANHTLGSHIPQMHEPVQGPGDST